MGKESAKYNTNTYVVKPFKPQYGKPTEIKSWYHGKKNLEESFTFQSCFQWFYIVNIYFRELWVSPKCSHHISSFFPAMES